MSNLNLTKELVKTFNTLNFFFTGLTNFTISDQRNISIEFAPDMSKEECLSYLKTMGNKIRSSFVEGKGENAFNVNHFPFHIDSGSIRKNKSGNFELCLPINSKIIFNLKSYLANSIIQRVIPDSENKDIYNMTFPSFDKGEYLLVQKFESRELAQTFKKEFVNFIEQRYDYDVSSDIIVKDNKLCITYNFVNNLNFVRNYHDEDIYRIFKILCTYEQTNHKKDDLKMLINQRFFSNLPDVNFSFFINRVKKEDPSHPLMTPYRKENEHTSLGLSIVEVDKVNAEAGFDLLNPITPLLEINDSRFIDPDKADELGVYAINLDDPEVVMPLMEKCLESAVIGQVDGRCTLIFNQQKHKQLKVSNNANTSRSESGYGSIDNISERSPKVNTLPNIREESHGRSAEEHYDSYSSYMKKHDISEPSSSLQELKEGNVQQIKKSWCVIL